MSRFFTNGFRQALVDRGETDESLLESSVRDIYRAPAAGVVRFGQGLGDLIDTAGEAVGVDAVDDYYWQEERLKDLGIQTRTIGGGFARGIVQNALAFVPVVGAMGRVGLLAKAGQVGTGLAKAAGLAETFGAAAGRYAASSVVGGAVADFVSQQGNEGRLADLAKSFGANNAFVNWLATDQEDSWAEGRLKNVLEGALLGPLVDAGIAGGRKALLPAIKAAKLAAQGRGVEIPDMIAREVEKGNLPESMGNDLQDATTGSTMPQDASGAPQATVGAPKDPNASDGLVDEMAGSPRSMLVSTIEGPDIVSQKIDSGYAPMANFTEADQLKFNAELEKDIAEATKGGAGLEDALAGHVVNRIRFSKFKTSGDAVATIWAMSEYLKKAGVTEGPTARGGKRTIDEMVAEGKELRQILGDEGVVQWIDDNVDNLEDLPAVGAAINSVLRGAGENYSDISTKIKLKREAGTLTEADEAEGWHALSMLYKSTEAAKTFTRPVAQATTVQRADVFKGPAQAAAKAIKAEVDKSKSKLETLKQAATKAGNEKMKRVVDALVDLEDRKLSKITKPAKDPNAPKAAKSAKDPSTPKLVKHPDFRVYTMEGQSLFDFMETAYRIETDPTDILPTGKDADLTASSPGGKVTTTGRPKVNAGWNGRMPSIAPLLDRFDAAAANGQTTRFAQILGRAAETSAKAVEVVMEAYKAAILSGIPTFTTNGLSSTFNLNLQVAARTVGAAMDAAMGKGTKELEDSLELGLQMIGSAKDMVRLASMDTTDSGFKGFATVWRSILTEEPQITGNKGLEYRRAIRRPDKPASDPVNIAGRVIRSPFTANQALEETTKAIAYRSMVRQKALREAKQMLETDLPTINQMLGKTEELTGAEKEAFKLMWVDLKEQMSFDTHGRAQGALNREDGGFYDAESMAFADDVGYTRDLQYGLGKTLQDTVAAHPLLGFALPFIKSPTLIFRQFVNMTPGIGQLQYAMQQRIGYLNPEQALRARGEQAIGGALWIATGYLAMNDQITGGGPSSKAERETLLASGWRPYSFVLTDANGNKEYIEYRRFDPVAQVFGLMADFTQARAYMDEDSVAEVATAMSLAMANNITNKTYFTGLTELLKAVTSPDVSMKGYLQNRISAFVPNFLARGASAEDEYMREARTIFEAVKRRIPGLSEDLPPKRNILGEAVTPPAGYLPFTDTTQPGMAQRVSRMVSPAAFSKQVDDPVKQELAKLAYGFSLPSKDYDGVDLTQITIKGRDGYDYYQEKVGKVRINGKTLAQALSQRIKSPGYTSLPSPMDRNDEDNPRVKAVRATIQRYREKAKRDLLRESPELKRAIKALERASTAGQQKAPILRSLEDL